MASDSQNGNNKKFKDIILKNKEVKKFFDFYKKHKIISIILMILLILSALPIWPSKAENVQEINIRKVDDFSYEIPLSNVCGAFSIPEETHDNKFNIVFESNTTKSGRYKNLFLKEYGEIRYPFTTFGDWNIHITRLNICPCLNNQEIDASREKSCETEYFSVMGYMDKCERRNDYIYGNEFRYTCSRYPFIISRDLGVISPDKSFKATTRIRYSAYKYDSGSNLQTNEAYTLIIKITYQDLKPLPYVRWIISGVLFLLSPISKILEFIKDRVSFG